MLGGPVRFVAFPLPRNPGQVVIRDIWSWDKPWGKANKRDILRELGIPEAENLSLLDAAFLYSSTDGPRLFSMRDIPRLPTLEFQYLAYAALGVLLLGGYLAKRSYILALGFAQDQTPSASSLREYFTQLLQFFISASAARNVLLSLGFTALAGYAHWGLSSQIYNWTMVSPPASRLSYMFGIDVRFMLPFLAVLHIVVWVVLCRLWFVNRVGQHTPWLLWLFPAINIVGVLILVRFPLSVFLVVHGAISLIVWLHWTGLERANQLLKSGETCTVMLAGNPPTQYETLVAFHGSQHLYAIELSTQRRLVIATAGVAYIAKQPS